MKKIIPFTTLLVLINWSSALACELCKKSQPKVLQNITHGTGPTGTLDYIIIWSAVVIVSITLFYSIKFLFRPEEKDSGHIKNIVLDQTLPR